MIRIKLNPSLSLYLKIFFELTQKVPFQVPNSNLFRTSNDNPTHSISGQMTVVVNSDDGELSEIIIDENILSALYMSQNEFNREFNKKYNTTVASSKSLAGWFTSFTLLLQEDNQPAIQDNDESLSDCIIKCHQEFTDENGKKIRGRGACKAGCWFEAASDFVVELIQTVF